MKTVEQLIRSVAARIADGTVHKSDAALLEEAARQIRLAVANIVDAQGKMRYALYQAAETLDGRGRECEPSATIYPCRSRENARLDFSLR